MIDDAFLRQTAALQANLKMLESQQDALSDLTDMKELRLYKARLFDYIESHSKAGHLPRDPFQSIERRIVALSEFFSVADKEFERLKTWKKDWLKKVPSVTLGDLHFANAELEELVAETPRIQQDLNAMLSPLDWDFSKDLPDIHAELLTCAQTANGIKLPKLAKRRSGLYQFAHGEGELLEQVSRHFEAMAERICELIALHEKHSTAVAHAEQHLANHDFRSAAGILKELKQGFADVPYAAANKRLKDFMARRREIEELDKPLDENISRSELKNLAIEIARLRSNVTMPQSEFGQECNELLNSIDGHLARLLSARKSLNIERMALFVVTALLVTGATLMVQNAKNVKSKEALEAKAQAEKAAIEAIAMAEKEAGEAYVLFRGERAGEEKVIEITPGVAMTFCWIPPGKFTMGSPVNEEDRRLNENQVDVTMTLGFWMAKTEVTQAQWQAVMGKNPSQFKGANLPVENVSWNDVQGFLTKVNAIAGNSDGGKMVLPTEAQWEYAARAGEMGPYSGGTIDELAWYSGNSGGRPHPVGTKKPNAWGIHDMHGNVWEWCANWYTSELQEGVDQLGPNSGSDRVIRGGGWSNGANYCRAAARVNGAPGRANINVGFRLARSSVP